MFVGAIADVLGAHERNAFEQAHFGQRVGFHVHDLELRIVMTRFEAVAGSADPGGQVQEGSLELDHARHVLEGRLAMRKAEPTHVHVALHEAVTGDQGSRREMTAPGRPEVDDEWPRSTLRELGQTARQPIAGVDLADARIEHVRALRLELSLPFGFEGHHHQDRASTGARHGASDNTLFGVNDRQLKPGAIPMSSSTKRSFTS